MEIHFVDRTSARAAKASKRRRQPKASRGQRQAPRKGFPIPCHICKDILGSYTYVGLVSAQAHSFTRPHESEVNTSNGCGTHIQTYGHVSTCMQLYTYLITPPESRMTPCYDE